MKSPRLAVRRAGRPGTSAADPTSSSLRAFYVHNSVMCLTLDDDDDDADKDDALSAMEESSLSESEDDEIISSIRPSKKVIYSSESDMSDKPSDGS